MNSRCVTVTLQVVHSGQPLTWAALFGFARAPGKLYYRDQQGISPRKPAAFRRDRSGDFVPASYKIDKERRLVTSTMTGVLTQAEVLEQVRQLLADPAVDPVFSQLVDCRQVTELKCTAEEVRQIADTDIFSASRAGRSWSRTICYTGSPECMKFIVS